MYGFPLKKWTAQMCHSMECKEKPVFPGGDAGFFSLFFSAWKSGEIFLCLFHKISFRYLSIVI